MQHVWSQTKEIFRSFPFLDVFRLSLKVWIDSWRPLNISASQKNSEVEKNGFLAKRFTCRLSMKGLAAALAATEYWAAFCVKPALLPPPPCAHQPINLPRIHFVASSTAPFLKFGHYLKLTLVFQTNQYALTKSLSFWPPDSWYASSPLYSCKSCLFTRSACCPIFLVFSNSLIAPWVFSFVTYTASLSVKPKDFLLIYSISFLSIVLFQK